MASSICIEAGGRDTVQRLNDTGAPAHFHYGDITDFAAVESAFADIAATLGPVTRLVNNAAFTEAGSLETISLDGWHREININLNGTYHCTRAIVPSMRERDSGAIVNIASVNALRHFGYPSYNAVKAGIIRLTKAVASEYGALGIRCNAVCPSSVRTDNITWTIRQQKDPDVFKKLTRWYPVGRVGDPSDVAQVVAFLRSPEAAYISGAVLNVDGALTAGINVMIDDFILEALQNYDLSGSIDAY